MKRLLFFLLLASCLFGQGQDSIRAVNGVLTISIVPAKSFYKVFVDQTITSTTITGQVAGTIITVYFLQDSTGHTVTLGGNIGSGCTVSSNPSATTGCQFAFDSANNQWTSIGGGGIASSSPLPGATSGPGPVFNVKNYGAKGDWQSSNNGTVNTSNTQTCSDCAFTQADVGKTICGSIVNVTELPCTTIDVVNSGTSVHTVGAATNTISGNTFAWGTSNDAAVTSAVTAAIAVAKTKIQVGNLGVVTSAPQVYFPAGAYGLCTSNLLITGSGFSGFSIIGDGSDQTVVYGLTGCTFGGTATAVIGMSNAWNYGLMRGFTFDGMNGSFGGAITSGFFVGSNLTKVQDVIVQRVGSTAPVLWTGKSMYVDNFNAVGNNSGAGGVGIQCTGCDGEVHNSGSSNNGGSNASAKNLVIQNVQGLNGGRGLRWWGGLIDECGAQANGCTQVINSSDVWFIGAGLFSTNSGQAVNIDGNSFVHMSGGIAGVFGNDTNASGIKVQAGGILQASDVRFVSTGTGNCVNNSGVLNDNGGNSCESMFVISSGTSTGTTAVLTLATAGANVNTNCSVGDALMVQGASIAGYDGYYPAGATSGITATSATTLTYTTAGSNLGALGAGGTAFCRNLQSFTGTLPKALLNNPIPNTCYITGTFAATTTAAPMCAFKLGSATNINQIKATSTTTTACTVAPVVTITDGTVSETLTITTAKSIWDSSVDISTGVGTSIFKPNGTITLSNTAGTCTTPPTNFSVSYNISPILSN